MLPDLLSVSKTFDIMVFKNKSLSTLLIIWKQNLNKPKESQISLHKSSHLLEERRLIEREKWILHTSCDWHWKEVLGKDERFLRMPLGGFMPSP